MRAVSKPKAKPPAPQPIPVATAAVTAGNLDVYLDALGTVTPVYTVTIVSRVAGEITEVHFKEGQIVKKNDLLAVIDPRPYEAALMQAQGQLARDDGAAQERAHRSVALSELLQGARDSRSSSSPPSRRRSSRTRPR